GTMPLPKKPSRAMTTRVPAPTMTTRPCGGLVVKGGECTCLLSLRNVSGRELPYTGGSFSPRLLVEPAKTGQSPYHIDECTLAFCRIQSCKSPGCCDYIHSGEHTLAFLRGTIAQITRLL